MSRRQVRRLAGSNTLPPPDSDTEDNNDVANFKIKSSVQSLYAGLELSSESDNSEPEPNNESEREEEPKIATKKKNKSKKKANKQSETKEDDIEKSLREVNALLGTPPPAPTKSENTKKHNPFLETYEVTGKNLNVQNELRRLFGSEDDEAQPRRKPQRTLTASRKIIIIPQENIQYNRNGLSMSVESRVNDVIFFTFNHNAEYQKTHRLFLLLGDSNRNSTLSVQEELRSHVESQLEVANALFEMEEYGSANTLVEYVIGIMQQAMHPLFNLNSDIRLEYKYLENRPFYAALLKYVYLLTNKACHRTALEVAKLLMRLDHTDPVAVLLVIDTLALRARQHEWLLSAIDYWSENRDAAYLYNMQYSKALAKFHVATKNKDDLTVADGFLKDAILHFPTVIIAIKQITKDAPSGMDTHELFTSAKTGKNVSALINMYSQLVSIRWREQNVAQWVNRNISEVMQAYNTDPSVKDRVKTYMAQRISLFQIYPQEIVRHLGIIQSMSKLVLDGTVPVLPANLIREPLSGVDTINRYDYQRPNAAFRGQSFLESLFPHNINFDVDQ